MESVSASQSGSLKLKETFTLSARPTLIKASFNRIVSHAKTHFSILVLHLHLILPHHCLFKFRYITDSEQNVTTFTAAVSIESQVAMNVIEQVAAMV